MKERLFTIAVAVSSLLCLATAVFWVRSHFISDVVVVEENGTQVQYTRSLVCQYGGIRYASIWASQTAPGAAPTPQISDGARTWRFGRERTADYDLPVRVAQAEHRYPFPFLHSSFSIWNRLGFAFLHAQYPRSSGNQFRMLGITVPMWSLFIAFLAMPLMAVGKWARRRLRAQRGCCFNCGYDLRATPERCPECGETAKRLEVTSK